MPKVLANGINFHYLQTGSGQELIMLHGLMGNLAVWHLKMASLLREHYHITTFDLRGHGRSDMPPTGYSTGSMADDLLGVMDALGIERADLVGHSIGADVCLHFALRYPERVRKLVLIEAAIPALVHLRKDETWEGWGYWAQVIEEFTGTPVPQGQRMDLAQMVRLSMDVPILFGPARGMPRKREPVLKLLETTTLVEDYERLDGMTFASLAHIPHPKQIIYDSGSPYMGTYHILRDTLTNCTSVLFPPSKHRHFSPLEQPERLVGYIHDFLVGEPSDSSNGPAEILP